MLPTLSIKNCDKLFKAEKSKMKDHWNIIIPCPPETWVGRMSKKINNSPNNNEASSFNRPVIKPNWQYPKLPSGLQEQVYWSTVVSLMWNMPKEAIQVTNKNG